MSDGADDKVVTRSVRLGDLETVVALDFFRRRYRIGNLDLMPQPLQPPDEVEGAAIAEVGHISLNVRPRTRTLPAFPRRLWSVSAIQPPMPSLVCRPARITCGSWPTCCARWLR